MLDMLCVVVVQEVLLFRLGSWVLLAEMDKITERYHNGFLCQIMGERACWNTGGMWVTLAAGEVQEAVGVQLASIYIGRIQVTVAQWVVMCPIFKVTKGINVTGGGGAGVNHGGNIRRQKISSGKPWRISRGRSG